MTSRERVKKSLNHEIPDRVPLDLGATPITGIAASSLNKLRKALGLADRVIKIHEPFQLLGMVEEDVLEALGIDVVGIYMRNNYFGYANEGWKPWQLSDGTPVQVGAGFVTTVDENGETFIYPAGDITAQPSGRMPKDGFYFDVTVRQEEIDEDRLDPEEWVKQTCGAFTDEDFAHLEKQANDLYYNTDKAIVGNFGQGGLGDIGMVPGASVRDPKGIRNTVDWYMATLLYPKYIRDIFELQTEAALKNLEIYRQAVGDKIEAIWLSGTDFGAQNGPFISPDMYRDLYKPFHKRMNQWIHENTNWKSFLHTCGAVVPFLDDFIDAGFDILNPVQTSATGMEPAFLKEKYGKDLVFWGGGIDTQHVLPFSTPDEISKQVKERIEIFGKDGGFVFNAIHNIQPMIPQENLVALFKAVNDYRSMDW